jgi:hypothetical protein
MWRASSGTTKCATPYNVYLMFPQSHYPYCPTIFYGAAWPARINQGVKEMDLLWTIAVILVILWLLGLVTSYTLGGFIHILLVLAIVVILIRVIQGRRPV